MPRKNPFPDRERQIGERLREFRAWIKLSRSVFAGQAGLDASLLRSYECARSQLNYSAAYKVIMAFGLNPEWLATGNGRMWLALPIPSPKELNVGVRAPFSKIYEKHLAKVVAEQTKKWESRPPPEPIPLHINAADPRARLMAEAQMVNWLRRLVLCLPDSKLEDFLNFLYLLGTRLARSYPADLKGVFEKRIEAMDCARAQMESHKHFLADEQPGRGKPLGNRNVEQCKDILDMPKRPDKILVVKMPRVPTWAQLKKDVARLTAGRGEKAALAAKLGVSRQVLGNWLSSDDQGTPNANLSLKLLDWVFEKMNETKSPEPALTSSEPKTRKRKSSYEKPKSNPQKPCHKTR